MNQLKFAMRIKEARNAKGYTQKELASRLQVTDKAVSKWERALSFPDIELLAPISKELDIPLVELLEVEELGIKEGQSENLETLLQKLIPLMKEKVQKEIQRKKKWLYILIAIFACLSVILVGYEVIRTWYCQKEYAASENIISYKELTINQIEENNKSISVDISVPETTAAYDVFTKVWRDKDNPEIAYIQFFYYEKQWLLYDSMKAYVEYIGQRGEQSLEHKEEFSMPVTKIIYYDAQENVLWEK